ncbi:hypothetical protein L202_07692 [Cryptococcus amylolentus CBS 6039]|uniref:Uncharacterized protein n=2 Tax=Cryptococcus amylolentus TaxID=104669 RepID=A0A1E3HBG7_9TREE|nr:hypothetical protein L202_07692 [Cryptococcus amylolentus CBS 6039]ODN73126.1 hypothetical protein L202_07692 [Cryptococcus amylolentus CBS 6039]ODN98957.1 hypothetical protein I350_07106 [Cryptococcus amylolentus CBS 6273]
MSSNPETGDVKSEIIITTILLEGSYPTLVSIDGASGHDLQRQIEPPLIGRRLTLRSLSTNENGEEVLASPADETVAAMGQFMGRVFHVCDGRRYESPLPEVPHWRDRLRTFRNYTHETFARHQNHLSEAMQNEYASRDSWPFTYRVHSDVEDYLKDGGQLTGPGDMPRPAREYAERLRRAVKSAKSFDELCAVPPDTVKIAFTTEILEPFKLMRASPSRSGEEDDGRSLDDWTVLVAKPRVECRVTDDSPEWVKSGKFAQDTYINSIIESIDKSSPPEPTAALSRDRTVDDFVQGTQRFEDNVFEEVAYDVAHQLSFTSDQERTDEVVLSGGETGDASLEEGQLVDGHLVKVAWLEPSMFESFYGLPPRERRFYSKRLVEYETSIKEGFAEMQSERDHQVPGTGDAVSFGKTSWGTWPQRQEDLSEAVGALDFAFVRDELSQ